MRMMSGIFGAAALILALPALAQDTPPPSADAAPEAEAVQTDGAAPANPHAMLPHVVTVEEVLASPMISDPLHRLDCCVISDGGGAVVIVSPDVAKGLERHSVKVLGHGEAP